MLEMQHIWSHGLRGGRQGDAGVTPHRVGCATKLAQFPSIESTLGRKREQLTNDVAHAGTELRAFGPE